MDFEIHRNGSRPSGTPIRSDRHRSSRPDSDACSARKGRSNKADQATSCGFPEPEALAGAPSTSATSQVAIQEPLNGSRVIYDARLKKIGSPRLSA
jgi:hypothetical protein